MYQFKIYFHYLTFYDYFGIFWVLLSFFLFIILAFCFIRKKTILSLFIFIFSFIFLIVAFLGVKTFLDNTVRKNKITILHAKQLHFENALIISGKLKNLGKINFSKCIITFKISKKTNNKIKNIIYNIKPISKRSIIINKNISKGNSYFFKTILNNIIYKNNLNLTAHANCY